MAPWPRSVWTTRIVAFLEVDEPGGVACMAIAASCATSFIGNPRQKLG
jgi:hypothetical protein